MRENLVLISGYGAPGEEDIALYSVSASGASKAFGMTHGRAPSFCCRGENGLIYAASEREDGSDITAYALENGALRAVRTLETPGNGLCHVYAHGAVVYGCCYGSGDYFAVDADLTRVLWQFRPESAHAHWANVIDGKLYLMDLGNDCIYRWALENGLPAGEKEILRQPAGSGPRQILAAREGARLCVNELDGTVRVLNRDGGAVSESHASAVQEPQNWPGGACLGEDGTLYVCNRGPNTVSAWAQYGEKLAMLGEWPTGNWPRHLAEVPGTEIVLVACQRENEARGYAVRSGAAREAFRLPLAGASCVLPL